MQLCQAESLGILYHYDRGIRHVDAYFYYDSGNKDVHLVGTEVLHYGFLLFLAEPPVQKFCLMPRISLPYLLKELHHR